MYGAILGDIIGSPYEFDRGKKTKEFPFFDRGATFTDDSVMTIAVAEALMRANGMGIIEDEKATKDLIIDKMHEWGHRYPDAGYGGRFYSWLKNSDREPYNSWGNGSAMRVSSAGWLFEDLETTRRIAAWTAEVTHNHPEGIKGAEATASAIWMARNGYSKDEIKEYIIREFGYDLSRTCDEIRPGYYHIESCQQTVPEAITAFLEGDDFEDVIRTAVSLGGDCDTLTCIAGSIAEAFYGVPDYLKDECGKRLPDDLADILLLFHSGSDADSAEPGKMSARQLNLSVSLLAALGGVALPQNNRYRRGNEPIPEDIRGNKKEGDEYDTIGDVLRKGGKRKVIVIAVAVLLAGCLLINGLFIWSGLVSSLKDAF